jgi:hypothetical protein
MSQSLFATAVGAIGAVSNSLMQIQSRAEAHRSASIDPRDLPEQLQRDIGLVDGRFFGAEEPRRGGNGSSRHWTDLIQTPHAA